MADNKKNTGRAKPLTPKAGVTKKARRYSCGGKMSTKKRK